MSIVVWMFLGLMAGLVAGKLVPRRGNGRHFVVLPLGVLGAVVGGLAFNLVRALGASEIPSAWVRSGITDFSVWSLFVACLGAFVALATFHVFTYRRTT